MISGPSARAWPGRAAADHYQCQGAGTAPRPGQACWSGVEGGGGGGTRRRGSTGRAGATPSGIRIVSYVKHISGICLTYSKKKILTYARYIPGIYLRSQSSVFIGFNACIHCIAWTPASAGMTDRDLAWSQFRRNCDHITIKAYWGFKSCYSKLFCFFWVQFISELECRECSFVLLPDRPPRLIGHTRCF
jgi:hypothetical protein